MTADVASPAAPVIVEACIDSVASALAAERGGAARLELCAALHDAGTTPSAGTIAAVRAAVALPLLVLVRPRGGDFVHSAAELDVMARDVEAALALGADGVVLGALREDGRVDERATRRLVALAAGRPVTFHRAVDAAPDFDAAVDAALACGARRVLTSGGAATARDGAAALAGLVARVGAAAIVAGGGIREPHVAELVRLTGVRELHVRGTRVNAGRTRPHAPPLRRALPDAEGDWEETDEARIRALVALAAAGAAGGERVPA